MLDTPPSTYVELSMLTKKHPTFNVSSSFEKGYLYSQVLPIMIADIYVTIMYIYSPLNDYGWYGSNIRHSMLDLHNENSV